MNDFTKKEQDLLNHLSKQRYADLDIQKKIDEIAQQNGYENYKDFLIKSGWLRNIAAFDFEKTKSMRFKKYDPITFELRDRDE